MRLGAASNGTGRDVGGRVCAQRDKRADILETVTLDVAKPLPSTAWPPRILAVSTLGRQYVGMFFKDVPTAC